MFWGTPSRGRRGTRASSAHVRRSPAACLPAACRLPPAAAGAACCQQPYCHLPCTSPPPILCTLPLPAHPCAIACPLPLRVCSTGPFSHRVLLVLEEKEIPYTLNYVDATNKPEWWVLLRPAPAAVAVHFGGLRRPLPDPVLVFSPPACCHLPISCCCCRQGAKATPGQGLLLAPPLLATPLHSKQSLKWLAPYCCPLICCRVSTANPQGTLPIVKDLSSGQFIPDSDAISGEGVLHCGGCFCISRPVHPRLWRHLR
jgi:hypothetical protein